MKPLFQELRGCRTKKYYETEKGAKKAAAKQTIEYKKPMRYYECDICGGFHLTSKLKENNKWKNQVNGNG